MTSLNGFLDSLPRPHRTGAMPVAGFYAALIVAFAGGLVTGRSPVGGRLAAAVLLAALVVAVARAWRRRHRLMGAAHVRQIRAAVGTELPARPEVRTSSGGITVAVSASHAGAGTEAHVSLSCESGRADLEMLCRLAAAAFPGLSVHSAYVSKRGVLHVLVPTPIQANGIDVRAAEVLGRSFFGAVLERAQRRAQAQPSAPPAIPEEAQRPWYYGAM